MMARPLIKTQHLVIAVAAGILSVSDGLAQLQESKRIDQIVEANLAKEGITPNAPASDEVFVRRIYLDVIGRIPTQAEATAFLESKAAGKRSKLIDHLLDSDGYVSHSFNYWADLLRAKSRSQGNSGGAYIEWIKKSVAENKPYDQMVNELITAEGKVWDNGAVGYYMRDSGMPLDNMSNTARIFLGTRLECAQCHNHPFDKWTQMDYYKLAAFTYGVNTRVNAQGELGIQEIIDKDAKRRKSKLNLSGSARRALGDILEPLSYGAGDTDRKVSLPDDYAYEDRTQGPVTPEVPFAKEALKQGRKTGHREEYANWLTSRDNERFTTVVANRMWKRAMGMGLIEPIDDIKETTKPSSEELMRNLEGVMRNGNYDIKRFLRVVYNTRTYQRSATVDEVPADKPYHFQGPLLRRMTAEQMWDSYITLSMPKPDARKGSYGGDRAKQQVEQLRARSPQSILDQAVAIGKAEDTYQALNNSIREKMRLATEADDAESLKQLRKEMNDANKARREAVAAANKAASEGGMMMGGGMSMMDMMAKKREDEMAEKMEAERKAKGIKKPKDAWAGYGRHLLRASEIQSPAPNGHFLREFGQSDRDLIENGHKDTSVSQALDLLNGPVSRDVLNDKSVLKKALAAGMSTDEKVDALFMSVLSRKPTEKQREIANRQLEYNKETGADNLIWALMNTTEFAFVQ